MIIELMSHAMPHSMLVIVKPIAEPVNSQRVENTFESQPDIDLVLLDLMMPNLSGLDVLARIRSNERLKHLPCIILTAAGQEAQHQKAMELGYVVEKIKSFAGTRFDPHVVDAFVTAVRRGDIVIEEMRGAA